ncbi:MAG TPA: hypothetical protein DD990_07490, partial [Cyanobacteria bacterium UBA11368]|nr:hypothetical protein [Cyanobacteria bacterium UBA11368]
MITLSSQHTMQTISSKQVFNRHIAFIDAAVEDYQYLATNVMPGIETIILDSSTDGVLQIGAALGDRANISSLHIISHGSEASLQLGATELNVKTLWRNYADVIELWGKALSDRASILLYGCNVASGKLGQDFVQWLSILTGATVAASTTPTGNAFFGGNWELDVTTGAMQTSLAFPLTVQQAYQGVLMQFFPVTRYDDVV